MTSLLLEYFEEGDHEDSFFLTTESYISMLLWKCIDIKDEVDLKLIKSRNLVENPVKILISFFGISYEIEHDSKILSKLPILQKKYSKFNVVGLCSVLRGLLKTSYSDLSRLLLGHKENCLAAPSEVSTWTKLCERDMIECVEKLIKSNSCCDFPIELINLEKDLSNPVRIHNVYKVAREIKKDKTIKSGSVVELEHTFCQGHFISLADFMLFASFKIMFKANVYNREELKAVIPLSLNWYSNMKLENNFNDSFKSIFNMCTKAKSLQTLPDSSELNVDGKYFSLFKRDLTNHKHKDRRLYTGQQEVEEAIAKVMSLNLDIKSEPGKECLVIDDEQVDELLKCGDLPTVRLERKRHQLKSLAIEVVNIAKDGDVIVDFCSGTGHLGFLLAQLLPYCHIIVLENKEESVDRARAKAKSLQIDNVSFWQCNLEYFQEKFNIGVALHACGVATDLVLWKCWNIKANFVTSPCCYGKIQNLDVVQLPQSQLYRQVLNIKDFLNVAHCSDQTHDVNLEKTNVAKSIQGSLCMDIVDTDRLLKSKELGYTVELKRLFPENCSQKNRLLVGINNESLEIR